MAYRKTIGLCPQSPTIDMGLSLQDNLKFAGRYYGMSYETIAERSVFLMKRFGMENMRTLWQVFYLVVITTIFNCSCFDA